MRVNDKAVLVTGTTSGIGGATARAYAAAGANVVITGRDVQRGEQPARSLSSDGPQARFARADLEKIDDVKRLAADIGDIDVLVNNAGVFPFGPTHEVASESFGSTFANFGLPGVSLYGSTKAASTVLIKAWAADCGPKGVRVNAVAPGPTRTPGSDPMGDELDELAAKRPLGRPATPDDIAAAALFLRPDEASSVNGAVHAVGGAGRTAI